MPPILINKILKSTSPSSSSHGSSDNMTTEQREQQQTNGGGGGDDGIKKLTILHYNDVYNIDTQGIKFHFFAIKFLHKLFYLCS